MKGQHFFTGELLAETVSAVLFQDWYWPKPAWLPKSQIKYHSLDYQCEIYASSWICEQNKIEEEAYNG